MGEAVPLGNIKFGGSLVLSVSCSYSKLMIVPQDIVPGIFYPLACMILWCKVLYIPGSSRLPLLEFFMTGNS